jgi:hypothetical protein
VGITTRALVARERIGVDCSKERVEQLTKEMKNDSPRICMLNFELTMLSATPRRIIGVDIHARRTLPMNVLGTAPGKTTWSY